jgi:iron complex transport system ATP-binding protein
MLKAQAVSIGLDGRMIISQASFEARRGEITVLAGPNGAGKTTLLKAAAGLLPYDGTIRFDGEVLESLSRRERAARISYLAQAQAAHWPMSVFDIVALGRLPHRISTVRLDDADREAIEAALDNAGLSAFAGRRIDTLSQGEQARVMIARALCQGAPCLLADEPAAALDPYHQLQCLELLQCEAGRGTAVVIVLHNLGLAAQFADKVLLMANGRMVAAGAPSDVLTPERLESIYRIRPAECRSPLGPMWRRATS